MVNFLKKKRTLHNLYTTKIKITIVLSKLTGPNLQYPILIIVSMLSSSFAISYMNIEIYLYIRCSIITRKSSK